jgi:hypothetical protein
MRLQRLLIAHTYVIRTVRIVIYIITTIGRLDTATATIRRILITHVMDRCILTTCNLLTSPAILHCRAASYWSLDPVMNQLSSTEASPEELRTTSQKRSYSYTLSHKWSTHFHINLKLIYQTMRFVGNTSAIISCSVAVREPTYPHVELSLKERKIVTIVQGMAHTVPHRITTNIHCHHHVRRQLCAIMSEVRGSLSGRGLNV